MAPLFREVRSRECAHSHARQGDNWLGTTHAGVSLYLAAMSSSSPPHPQYWLGKPFILRYWFGVTAETPPKYWEYGSLHQRGKNHRRDKSKWQNLPFLLVGVNDKESVEQWVFYSSRHLPVCQEQPVCTVK